jgi:hypothetical protein
MTPELKTACELVFQEHKISGQPIKWNKDAFRGRISIGLSEMAKITLVKKNIILLPDKSKKVFTKLNPDVAAAGNFEEAEKIIETKIPGQETITAYDANKYIADHVVGLATVSSLMHSQNELPVANASETKATDIKWFMKPLFLYIVWPLCGAVAGALISLLMNLAYTELFSNLK